MIHTPKKRLALPRRQRGNLSMFPAGTTAVNSIPPVQFVTLGNTGGVVGYQDTPPVGSISALNDVNGLGVERLFSGLGANEFQVVLSSNVDPLVNAFSSITIQDGAGVDVTFLTNDLDGGSYFYIGGINAAFWSWGVDDTSRIWEVVDTGEVKNFTWVG